MHTSTNIKYFYSLYFFFYLYWFITTELWFKKPFIYLLMLFPIKKTDSDIGSEILLSAKNRLKIYKVIRVIFIPQNSVKNIAFNNHASITSGIILHTSIH